MLNVRIFIMKIIYILKKSMTKLTQIMKKKMQSKMQKP